MIICSRPFRVWLPAIIALFPVLLQAQSVPVSFVAGKGRQFFQTGSASLTEYHAVFIVSSNLITTTSRPTATLAVAGRTYPISTNGVYEQEFETVAEMERVIPAGFAMITPTWPTNTVPQLVLATPYVEIPSAPAIPEAPITNFDALQNWDGGPLTISYKVPPSASTSTTAGVNLVIWRASDINLSSNAHAVTAVIVSGTGSVTTNDVTAAPGETLYGELPLGIVTLGNTPIRSTSTSLGWVRFPIHRRAAVSAPVIVTPPRSTVAVAGDSITLSVAATGDGLAYQWQKDGIAISGATASTLELKSLQASDAGSYNVVISNAGGSVASEAALVTVNARSVAPTIASAPASTSVAAGTKITVSATASGTAPLTYQWLRNGTAIAGATQSTFTLERPRPSDSGQYSVTITNPVGSVTSAPAELRINPVSRISNLSILTTLDSAADNFTLGFVLRGNSNGGKPVLMRAVGPSLAALGVAGALEDPKLELLDGTTLTLSNDNWGGATTLSDVFRATGAFGFASPTSKDAASLTRVSTTNNSIRISGTGSGLVLAELYDATLADDFEITSTRFVNVSVLKNIGSGLTAGFVIDGTEPVRLLVRAVGPALAGFGVVGAIADPKLELFRSGSATAISTNDNWGSASNASEVAAVAASVGAFALAADSKDAVLLVRLEPGSYTAQINGVNNTTGVALIEIYEAP